MPEKIDLTGRVFGYLTVIGRDEKSWWCRCVCGKEKRTMLSLLKRIKSCGCKRGELVSDSKKTHGMKGTRVHNIWSGMKERCRNPKVRIYKHYGGRGITVCKEWLESFEAFRRDMGEPPPRMQLDRIDNNAGYSPENCRWATVGQNLLNKRNNHWIEWNGIKKTLKEWSEQTGISAPTIRWRLRSGWTPEETLTRSVEVHRKVEQWQA